MLKMSIGEDAAAAVLYSDDPLASRKLDTAMNRLRPLAWMVAVLLLALLLRAQDLPLMRGMLHYDEAYYALDALSLLNAPRLTPFFPENFGRESLWMYLLAPALAVFGADVFALRLVALFTGVLTVAAVYRLGRELFGWRAGVWSAAALAVLFWHVLASHQAFRALLFPLVGTLALAALWRAAYHQRRAAWLWVALWSGMLAYTYIAARAWLLLAALWLVTTLPRRRDLPAVARAIALFVLLSAPLGWVLLTNPALASQRGEQVAIASVGQLTGNIAAWAGAWFIRGSEDIAYNLPSRPILDTPLLLLGCLGIAGLAVLCVHAPRRAVPRAALFLVLLFGASLAPALLTTDTLKPLRALGVVIPLALTLGMGASAFGRAAALALRAPWLRSVSALVAALLLGWAGISSSSDFAAWVRSPSLFLPMEQHLMRGFEVLRADAVTTPVYFSPFTPAHPVIRFRAGDLAPRPVSAFDGGGCLRFSMAGGDYFALTMFDPGFAERLRPYAQVALLDAEPLNPPRFHLYRAHPNPWIFEGERAAWTAGLALAWVDGLPASAAPGDALPLRFGLRAPPSPHSGAIRPHTLFAHLYGSPTPYEGGVLWAQADMPLCPGSPPATWRADEIVVQTTTLALPPDLPAGRYTLAIGIYNTLTGIRAAVTNPQNTLDYVPVAEVAVER